MNKRILVLCSSREGQTRKIVNTILKEAPEWQADIYNLHDYPQVDLKPYDKVLIAASIRYGHFHTSLNQFVKEHQAALKGIQDQGGCCTQHHQSEKGDREVNQRHQFGQRQQRGEAEVGDRH